MPYIPPTAPRQSVPPISPLPPALNDTQLLQAPVRPTRRVQRWIRRASGGRLGNRGDDMFEAALIDVIRQPLPNDLKVAFVCAKGGVSKSVQTAIVGAMLAHYRPSRNPSVVAVDFNPDQGTLGIRTVHHQQKAPGTIRGLIDHLSQHGGMSGADLERTYTGVTDQGLAVLASGNSTIDAQEITARQFAMTMDALHASFPLILIDTGNSMTTEIYASILASVDQIVLVGSYQVDAAYTASNTLFRIRQAGGRLESIANRALVSFSRPREVSPNVNLARIKTHFAESTQHGVVHDIPWDAHINEGGVIDITKLHPETRIAFMQLTADIVSVLAGNRPVHRS